MNGHVVKAVRPQPIQIRRLYIVLAKGQLDSVLTQRLVCGVQACFPPITSNLVNKRVCRVLAPGVRPLQSGDLFTEIVTVGLRSVDTAQCGGHYRSQ